MVWLHLAVPFFFISILKELFPKLVSDFLVVIEILLFVAKNVSKNLFWTKSELGTVMPREK